MSDSNIKLITSNMIDAATLSSTPTAESTLPVTNLQNNLRARVTRITGTSAVIDGEGLSGAVDGFALAHHNLTGDSSVRLRIYAGSNQTGDVVYDSTVITLAEITPWGSFTWGVDPWGSAIPNGDLPQTYAIWFDEAIGISFKCDISAPQNSVIDIGRMFIGKSFQPRINYSYGGGISWVEPATQTRTDGGSLIVEAAERFRRLNINLDWLDEGDRDLFSRLLRRAGKSGDILVALDPTRTDNIGVEETMVCKRTSDFSLHKAPSTYTKTQIVLEEI